MRHITKTLARRRVPYEAAEDIAQEVAVRALAKEQRQATFVSLDHLRGWCFLTAWRLATDRWRWQQRHPQLDGLPDVPTGGGLDQIVQYRDAARELLAAVGRLTANQQRAFGRILRSDFAAMQEFLSAVDALLPAQQEELAGVLDYLADPSAPEPMAGTERWGRHDVRQRLRRAVENFPVAAPGLRLALRSVHVRAVARERWLATVTMAGAAAAALSLLVAVEQQAVQQPVHAGDAPPAIELRMAESGAGPTGRPTDTPPPAAASDGPQAGREAPPDDPGLRVVGFPEPDGGSGAVNLVPNAPTRPLTCAIVDSFGGCVAKPAVLVPPPVLSG